MNLKQLRESKGITQTELAKSLGVVRSTICQYENGNHKPDPETLIKLADYFGISVDALLERKNSAFSEYAPALSPEKAELLALFDKMTPAQKVRFVGYGEGLLGSKAATLRGSNT